MFFSKFLILCFIYALIAYFWSSSTLAPFKVMVVFFHEISHAFGAFITNGDIISIYVDWDESGYTITKNGHFLTIALAGYLGSVFWGCSMLYVSVKEKFHRSWSIFLACLILLIAHTYIEYKNQTIYILLLIWSGLFLLTSFFYKKTNQYFLMFTGSLTTLYAVFDLSDFFRGNIHKTDAGTIASYYIKDTNMQTTLAYLIGILISILTIWMLIKTLMYCLKKPMSNKVSNSHIEEEPSALPPEETLSAIQHLLNTTHLKKENTEKYQ